VEEILAYCKEKEDTLTKLQDYDLYLETLRKRVADAEKRVKVASEQLSELRKEAAKELAEYIRVGLLDLNFLDVKFEIVFDALAHYTAQGIDDVEFMISTNPGEPIKPLGNVASGGELSRIMLAIKTVLAEKDQVETLIFDEIDVGISGRTAQKVSEKMAVIGKMHQVICITHLAQIAAMADVHYKVEKHIEEGVTRSDIKQLSDDERIDEIARIMGGVHLTEQLYKSAKELIDNSLK
jgi:DNA repair protein RecN (Recombination protein N)